VRADIQGMRAIAVLMVACYHADLPVPGGFTGVDVFFVVSGFVIAGMLLRELAASGRISFSRFYTRRIRRLLPALALVSVVTLLLAALIFSPLDGRQETTGLGVVSASALVANVYFLLSTGGYFQPVAQLNPFLHTWTLSVEEQFYLVFPLVLAVGWWLGRRRDSWRWLVGILTAGFVLSLGISVAFSYQWEPLTSRLGALTRGDHAPRLAFFLPVARGWEFLAGALVALAAKRWTPTASVRTLASGAGVVLLMTAIVALDGADIFPGILAAVPVVATVCLLVAGLGDSPPIVTRLLSTRPLVWIGDRSYGWYLWHWPAIVYARTLFAATPTVATLAAAGALIPAVLSYRFVEEPIRRGQRWPSIRATRWIAVACVGVPLVIGEGLVTAANRSWGSREIAAVRALVVPDHIDIPSRCASAVPLGGDGRPPCIWPTASARGTVLLIGDSNAGHLAEPFIAAAHALGYDAQIATDGGCPFLVRPSYFVPPCQEFVEGSLAAVEHRTPAYAAVVISNATASYLNGTLFAPQFVADAPVPVSGPVRRDRKTSILGWVTSMRHTIEALQPHSPIVVVGSIPTFADLPTCVRPTLFSSPVPGCGEMSPATAARVRTDTITAEGTMVRGLGAAYLDTGDRLCTTERGCSAFIDGVLVFRDGGHLNVEGSMRFEPDMRNALTAALHAGVERNAHARPASPAE
jgi:peptidoglycan/LPS O-acetylase OafA/YrhL